MFTNFRENIAIALSNAKQEPVIWNSAAKAAGGTGAYGAIVGDVIGRFGMVPAGLFGVAAATDLVDQLSNGSSLADMAAIGITAVAAYKITPVVATIAGAVSATVLGAAGAVVGAGIGYTRKASRLISDTLSSERREPQSNEKINPVAFGSKALDVMLDSMIKDDPGLGLQKLKATRSPKPIAKKSSVSVAPS